MDPIGLLVVAGGIFTICGAYFDWDWFVNSYRARPLMRIFGRDGTRIFYGLLGTFLVVMGFLLTFGLV